MKDVKRVRNALAGRFRNDWYSYVSCGVNRADNAAVKTADLVGIISTIGLGCEIERIKFNDPATIVWFSDGDKVVCVCDERDYFDKEKGVLHCIAKKFLGSSEVRRVSVEWEEADADDPLRQNGWCVDLKSLTEGILKSGLADGSIKNGGVKSDEY